MKIPLIESNFKKNVEDSFLNVKSHMSSLENEIKSIKTDVNTIKEDFLTLKEQIFTFLKEFNQNKPKKDNKNFLSSTGNKGVINNHQQSSTVINTNQHLNNQLINKFKQLTNREFSVFLAIYQLEEEIGKVTYISIANKLQVTEITARYYTNTLINKGFPIEKMTHYSNRVYLLISKEFRSLNLITYLLEKREYSPQTTLSKF